MSKKENEIEVFWKQQHKTQMYCVRPNMPLPGTHNNPALANGSDITEHGDNAGLLTISTCFVF